MEEKMAITPILKRLIFLLGIIFLLLGLLLLIIFPFEVGIGISLAVAGIGFVVTAIIIQIPPISISIQVIDENGSLLNHGMIKIEFPENDVTISKEINESGKTRIDNVPAQYAKSEFTIKTKIEGYQMDRSKSLKLSKKNRNIEVYVISKRADVLKKKKFGVILSGDLIYTKDIYDGFKKKLLECLPKIGYEPIFFSTTGSSEPNSKKTYTEIIEMFLSREVYDFYVTIGTQASEALNGYFLEKKMDRPLIFMGVTDPVLSKLVTSLKNRRDRRSIAGVSYCGPVENIAAELHFLFPENNLIFIFHNGYEQDVRFAQRIKKSRLYPDKLQLKELENLPSLDDFDEKNAIYFSWYTIEKMVETNKDGLDILRQRNVVATTIMNVESDGLAPVAVTTNDFLIGEYGANIVVDVLENNRRLGELDVREPEMNYYINCKTIKQKQLFIDPQSINKAKDKFNCD
jgi:ABC-type uncharacterized transport system substrate-binding protein